jgi:RNA polymerase sigma-70 factor, ECF subfamily
MHGVNHDAVLYESWVRNYSGDLYRSALRLCGEPDTAEELTQQAFYEAWRSIGALRDRDKGRAWLLSILRHCYMHWLRDRKRRPAAASDLAFNNLASAEPLPGEALARQEVLQDALSSLDERFKVPLLMVVLEGHTCQETARSLDLPLGTVLSRIHRAKDHLRARMHEVPLMCV